MNSLLHELQNNEAILLMYLANELPAQDRAEVEHMLDRDDALRLELAKIRKGYDVYHTTMQRLDAAMPPVSAFSAARAIGDTIRARMIEPESVDDHDDHHRRIHWVFYPIGAVAALLIGMFLWWEFPQDDNLSKQMPMVSDPRHYDPSYDRGGPRGFDNPDMQDFQVVRLFDAIVPPAPESDAQQQINTIKFLDQTRSISSSMQ